MITLYFYLVVNLNDFESRLIPWFSSFECKEVFGHFLWISVPNSVDLPYCRKISPETSVRTLCQSCYRLRQIVDLLVEWVKKEEDFLLMLEHLQTLVGPTKYWFAA